MSTGVEMASCNPVALVLGGITNHIILIEKLKKRGFYVVLVDYLDDPPAKVAADEHVQISTFDEEKIEKLAIERRAKLIINANLEHVNAIAIRISERLGLPIPYSSETALNVSDKRRMKQIMIDGGVPTSPFVCTDKADYPDIASLKYPLFVKPADGSGSKGVYRVEEPGKLTRFFEMSSQFSRNGMVIVEEEAPGRECNAYCFVNNGRAYLLNVAERYFGIGNGNRLTQCYGTFAPARFSEEIYSELLAIANKIATSFKLTTCPMFMQVRIDAIGVIKVIEFACRMAGGISHQVILERTGFDWFEGTIDAFLNNPIDFKLTDSHDVFIVSSLIAKPGVYGELVGYQDLIEDGLMDKISLARKRGSVLDATRANGEKVGFFTVRGASDREALEKVAVCFERLSLRSIDNEEMLRKDTYITAEFFRNM